MKRMIKALSLLLGLVFLTGCAAGWGEAEHEPSDNMDTPPASVSTENPETSEANLSALTVPADYFYRDSDGSGFVTANEVFDYVKPPYEQVRDFTGYYQEYITSGLLPDIGYGACTIEALYRNTGEPWSLTFLWQDGAPENYRQITLNVWPKEPTGEDHDSEYSRMDRTKMTKTTISSSDGTEVDVYGDLIRETGVYVLVWTMPDGTYCHLQGHGVGLASEDLPPILDFVINHGINFSDYPIELGAIWETVSLEECPDAFPGLIPTVEDDRIMTQGWVVLKDGVAQSAFLEYSTDWLDESQETDDYTYPVLSWYIHDQEETESIELGDINAVTEETVVNALKELDQRENNGWIAGIRFQKNGTNIRVVKPHWDGIDQPTWIIGDEQYRWIWQAIASIQES